MARKFFFVCAGMLALALAYHVGATTVEGQANAGMSKYLRPANITALDWILLAEQVQSFSSKIRWDGYRAIESVNLYAIKGANPRVGMTFLVNKQPYIGLSDDVAKEVFADVVRGASKILAIDIPEVAGGTNVYANFMVIDGGKVGEFRDGRVTLSR